MTSSTLPPRLPRSRTSSRPPPEAPRLPILSVTEWPGARRRPVRLPTHSAVSGRVTGRRRHSPYVIISRRFRPVLTPLPPPAARWIPTGLRTVQARRSGRGDADPGEEKAEMSQRGRDGVDATFLSEILLRSERTRVCGIVEIWKHESEKHGLVSRQIFEDFILQFITK